MSRAALFSLLALPLLALPLLALSLLAGEADAAVHYVNWALPPNVTQLLAAPGDFIRFDFTSGHTVALLLNDSCDFDGSATIAENGPAVFEIPTVTPGAIFLGCTVDDHCAHGMLLSVVIGSANSSNTTSAPTTVAPGNTTTVAPGNSTTVAPGNTTTVAPGNTTTVAPGNTTTPGGPTSSPASSPTTAAPGSPTNAPSSSASHSDAHEKSTCWLASLMLAVVLAAA